MSLSFSATGEPPPAAKPHPRTVGWFGAGSVAMGGIVRGLLLIGMLFASQDPRFDQSLGAVPLLVAGLILAWAAVPGWLELVLMYPNRVGGIAAACSEALEPYSPVLANLTGVCYWWGWVPACSLGASFAASAACQWWMPHVPPKWAATAIVLAVMLASLGGLRRMARLVRPAALVATLLTIVSVIVPMVHGDVDWRHALDFHLNQPFEGAFGKVTAFMAGLYLVGFATPAFEQSLCHVGETLDPERNTRRALFMSAALATLFFVALPIVWVGSLGPESVQDDIILLLGPTVGPMVGGATRAAAAGFLVYCLMTGAMTPLASSARTLAQLADDGLLPEILGSRSSSNAPWAATLLTAAAAVAFVWLGNPIWLIAASNVAYLIGISVPSVAVWLLRRSQPNRHRPFRAPRGTIALGLAAAAGWTAAIALGFEQFGLTIVILGLVLAYSGSAGYVWRKMRDRRKQGMHGLARSLHIKLTGAMLAVLALDALGYLIAVNAVPQEYGALIAMLQDIFVMVALLTVGVGLILPGMIAHSVVQVTTAADRLVTGTLADFTRAMRALAAGDLEAAKADFEPVPIAITSRDEVGQMAFHFNLLQEGIGRAAGGLAGAREGLQRARADLTETNDRLRVELKERVKAQDALRASLLEKDALLKEVHHRVKNNMQVVSSLLNLQMENLPDEQARPIISETQGRISAMALVHEKLYQSLDLARVDFAQYLNELTGNILGTYRSSAQEVEFVLDAEDVYLGIDTAVPCGLIINELLTNAFKHGFSRGGPGRLTVTLRRVGHNQLRLVIEDTGKGLPPDTDLRKTDSLGMQLVFALTEQLQGTIHYSSQPGKGTTFELSLVDISVPSSETALT